MTAPGIESDRANLPGTMRRPGRDPDRVRSDVISPPRLARQNGRALPKPTHGDSDGGRHHAGVTGAGSSDVSGTQ